jgi:hypothetical protein
MTQFTTTPARRSGGDLDVYTGLLLVATIVLAVGLFFLVTSNIDHSSTSGGDGGPFKLVD